MSIPAITRLAVLMATVPAATSLLAQTAAGRITGLVLDPSGAVIPNARVEARNLETGIVRATQSNAAGQYVLYPLQPGTYELRAEAPGFRRETLSDLRLDVATTLTRNITLALGGVEQQIVVAAEAESPLTQSVSVESVILREQIEALPLNGRDFNQLVLLAAGAVENINAGNGRDFGEVAANGNRAFSNEYLLDGTPNNDVFQGRAGAPVSVDLIREFKVTSGVAPAEYGQAGTQIIIATRAGSNQWRGSLFEYHRGNTWQARDRFNPGEQQPFLRNQFGFSIGGPVLLPAYNGRNRTFFFLNYEGSRQRQNVTRVATVAPQEFWQGDFSSLLVRGIQLRDPLDPARPPIPGNRLDDYLGGGRISKTAQRLQPFWGLPNRPGLANNRVAFAKEIVGADQATIRLDEQLAGTSTLGLRYTHSQSRGFTPSLLANGTGLRSPVRNHNAAASWSLVARPNLVNELRAGYAGYSLVTTYENADLPSAAALGIKGYGPPPQGIPPMPRISFSGGDALTQLNYGSNENYGMAALIKISHIYNLAEALTYSSGRHTLKAGFELRRTHLPSLQQSNASGRLSFTASRTSANSTGYPFSDFLMGLPSSTQEVPVKERILLKQTELASFVQDDWRLTPRLTLSLGLRHEFFLSPYEQYNRLAMFDAIGGAIVVASDKGRLPTSRFLPQVVAKLTDAQGRWRFPLLSDVEAGYNPRRLIDTHYRYWGPRVGIVYQADRAGHTVVRTGYGIFYTRYPIQYLLQTIAVNPPFAGLFNYSQRIVGGRPDLTIEAPFPEAGGTASVSPAGLQKDFTLPDNQQWNLTIERYLGQGVVGSLAYVGNKGTHLFRSINANAAYVDAATGQIMRRYQSTYGTSTINYRMTNGNSIYNAMQLELRRRGRRGLIMQANWTWAKGLDDVGQTVQASLLDIENLGRDRADSDYVRRHVIKLNAVWELPFRRGQLLPRNTPRWLARVAAGWRISAIWQYTTGMRFTPSFTASGGLANNRPDVVPGVRANLPRKERQPDRWFNPQAFAEVPPVDPMTGRPRFGNAGRNILIGPGLNVVDASLAKSLPIGGENRRLSFRLEAFNAFNHPNYDLPESNISYTNTVATINRTVKPMRQVQFALRYDF